MRILLRERAGASERGVRGRIRAIADFAIPRSDARNPGRKSPARPFNPAQSSLRCAVKAEIGRIFSASSYEVHPLAVRSFLSKRIHSRSSTSHAGEIKEAVYQVFIGDDPFGMITLVGRYYARYLHFQSCLFFSLSLSFFSTKIFVRKWNIALAFDVHIYICVYICVCMQRLRHSFAAPSYSGPVRFGKRDRFFGHSTLSIRTVPDAVEYRNIGQTSISLAIWITKGRITLCCLRVCQAWRVFSTVCTDWNYLIASRSSVKSTINVQ